MGKFLDSTGVSHLMSLIKSALGDKVDKVSGKGLSTNDYDGTAKGKVDAIPSSPVYTDRYVNGAAFTQDTTNGNVKMTLTRAGSDTVQVGANIPAASTSAYGVAKLTSAVNSTSEALAATAKAVKTAYDLAASKTDNAGTVTQVKIGQTTYDPTGGVVSLPSYPTTLPASDVSAWAKASQKPSYTKSEVGLGNVTNDAQVKRTEMGAAGGVATLDSEGKVPSSQLPSYVDDVVEGYYYNSKFYEESSHETEIAGEGSKIYVDVTSGKNKTYRYSGSAYVEISSSDVTGIKVGSSGTTISPSGGVITIPAYEAGAQVHIAPTTAEVRSALGTGSGTSKYLREDGTWATPPQTDISGKADKANMTAGTYRSVTVNAQGVVTAGSNPTTLSGYGITDAKIDGGVITLGANSITPLTSHQDISGKADKASTVSGVAYDTTNKKLTKTVNGTTSDVATASQLVTDGGGLKSHQTVKQDGISGATRNSFAECSVAAATAAKTATVLNGTPTLEKGLRVTVKFSSGNTASNPTLNVNGTGAKSVFYDGAVIGTGAERELLSGVCELVYDGTQWHLLNKTLQEVLSTNEIDTLWAAA